LLTRSTYILTGRRRVMMAVRMKMRVQVMLCITVSA
jgi:hypothetical protein